MAIIKPCPKCQKLLSLPEPMPAQVRCPKCGAVIKKSAPSQIPTATVAGPPPKAVSATMPGPSPTGLPVPVADESSTPTSSSRRELLVLLGVFGVLGVFVVLLVAGGILFALRSGEGEKNIKTADTKGPLSQEQPSDGGPPEGKETQNAELKKPLKGNSKSQEINNAIAKGKAFLKQKMLTDTMMANASGQEWGNDTKIGAIALAALTLLEADVPPQDPVIQNALAVVRKGAPTLKLGYALSTVLFFLNRLHDAEPLQQSDRDMLRSLALRLVAGQTENGCWNYVNLPITPKEEKELLQELKSNTYKPRNGKVAKGGFPPDISATQFVMLALWGSRRHDIPVRQVLFRTTTELQKLQSPGGTWNYGQGDATQFIDSSTCAGLIALALEKSLRDDKEFQDQTGKDPPRNPKADENRDKAFLHLAKAIGRTKEDVPANGYDPYYGKLLRASAHGDCYFLWSLERVCVIYDQPTINGKDWYRWGSEVLVKTQRDDGAWVDQHGPFLDTCFALLFLTKANIAKDLTETIRRTRLGN